MEYHSTFAQWVKCARIMLLFANKGPWCDARAPCLVKYRDGASACPSATILAFSSSRCFSVYAREQGFGEQSAHDEWRRCACERKNSDNRRAYQLLDWKEQHHCKYRLRNHLQSPFFSAEHVHEGKLVRRESQRREVLQAQRKRDSGTVIPTTALQSSYWIHDIRVAFQGKPVLFFWGC